MSFMYSRYVRENQHVRSGKDERETRERLRDKVSKRKPICEKGTKMWTIIYILTLSFADLWSLSPRQLRYAELVCHTRLFAMGVRGRGIPLLLIKYIYLPYILEKTRKKLHIAHRGGRHFGTSKKSSFLPYWQRRAALIYPRGQECIVSCCPLLIMNLTKKYVSELPLSLFSERSKFAGRNELNKT